MEAPGVETSKIVEIRQARNFIADTKMAPLSIFGTEEQIVGAAKSLQEIERLGSELRLLIINDFRFEDIF